MSVLRQANLLGQARVDVPHIRAIESSICADFDTLAGRIMCGQNPLVVSGFYLDLSSSMIGQPANTLELVVDGGVIAHFTASESGTIYFVPDSRTANEVLDPTSNTKVVGDFTVSSVNYIGLDLKRSTDASTSDIVQFLDADSLSEVAKTVPLARTLDYEIVISTVDFSVNSHLLPIAIITTDSGNLVASAGIQDARPMMFRLGSGGTVPDIGHVYPWYSRAEVISTSGNVFQGADKEITSQKSWMDAVMSRLWEVGGGEYWYSQTTDKNVKLLRTGAVMAGGEHFTWTLGTNTLEFQGLKVVFDNSVGEVNEIADATGVGGLTLADGQCVYVDLDRTQDLTGVNALVAQVADLTTLGGGSVPGARYIIAWRYGTEVFTRDAQFAVGTIFVYATTTSNGMVTLNYDASDNGGVDATPKVVISNGSNEAIALGLQRPAAPVAAGTLSIGTNSQTNAISISRSGVTTTIDGPVYVPATNAGSYAARFDGASPSQEAVFGYAGAPAGAIAGPAAAGGYAINGYGGEGQDSTGDNGGAGGPGGYFEGGAGGDGVGGGKTSGAGGVGVIARGSYPGTAGGGATRGAGGHGIDSIGGASSTTGGDGGRFVGGEGSNTQGGYGIHATGGEAHRTGTSGVGGYLKGAVGEAVVGGGFTAGSGGWGAAIYGGAGGNASGAGQTAGAGGVGIYVQSGAPGTASAGATAANGVVAISAQGGDGVTAAEAVYGKGGTGTSVDGAGGVFVGGGVTNGDGVRAAATGTGVAVKSTAGDMQVPNTNNYTYASAVTRYLFLNPMDFQRYDPSKYPEIGIDYLYYVDGAAMTTVSTGQLRLPLGATITAVHALALQTVAGTASFTTHLYGAQTTAAMVSLGSTTLTITGGATPTWYDVTNAGMLITVASDHRLAVQIVHVADGGANPEYYIRAIRITYTQTDIKPSI